MKNLILALCALGLSPALLAQPYMSVTLGAADVEYKINEEHGDDTDTALGVSGGFLLNEYFAIEGGFQMPYNGKVNVSGFNLGLVGIAPLENRFDVYGRLGLYWWAAELTAELVERSRSPAANNVADKKDNDAYFALGGKYRVNRHLDVGLEYTHYNMASELLGLNFDIEVGLVNLTLFVYH